MTKELQEALVSSYRTFEKCSQHTPTNAAVFAFVRSMGFRFRTGEAKTLLAKFRAKSRSGVCPDAKAEPSGNQVLHTAGPFVDQVGTISDGPTCVSVVPTPYPSPKNVPTERKKPVRVKPQADALPELPAQYAGDVQRLIAFDAGTRRDGRIAQSVIDTGMRRLQRAFERHGVEALQAGIDIAIGKGKGLAFAAGCVRHQSETVRPNLTLLSMPESAKIRRASDLMREAGFDPTTGVAI